VPHLPNKDGIQATDDLVRIDMTKAIAVHLDAEYRRSPNHARKEREP
jgi:hypothetical protein